MLPVTHRDSPEEAAKRQANFIILRTLESKLPPTLFQQVVSTVSICSLTPRKVSESTELPKRIDWQGEEKSLNFEEVKLNFSHVDQNYLPELLQSVGDGTNPQNSRKKSSLIPKNQSLPKLMLESGHYENLLVSRRSLHVQNFAADQKKNLKYYQISRFERMKTIFGHALIEEGCNAPIYTVMFDQSGSFVISGADDGIIKIWDKDTMNLQASLHSHNEVLTDMDISKCNKYLASSSKDGKVIIWDWKNCLKVDEFAAHNSTINNIKFFQVKIKTQTSSQKEVDKIQILVTCSEDGTIKIYDELSYLNSLSSNPHESVQKRRRQDQAGSRKERYCICLTPDDYRPGPGSRNKRIDSVNINSNGLVAAGTSTGDVFLWKLDLLKFKQQQLKPQTWLGSSKKHSKSVHFCEFSPNGKYLFTGSVDGTAKVWNLEVEKAKKGQEQNLGLTDNRLVVALEEKRNFNKQDNQIYFRNKFGDQVNLAEYRQQKNNWQCDSIAWSCNGRYAIASLSGKVDDNQDKNLEWSILKVWDSYTNQTIQDLGKENDIQLLTFSFVITPHPKIEEIFLSGSDGGIVCLWNIKTRQLIKKFLEYGVYSYEKYTMNDPYDGKFSPDGSCFVIGSVMGTISLFSCEGAKYKYEATRVEQFYPQDDQKHLTNIYYDQDEQPQVSGYSLIPYEVQPPPPLIGKFKTSNQLTNEDYERNLIVRQEMSKEEEKFIASELEEGLRNNFFTNNNQDLGQQLFNGQVDNQIYQEQIVPRRGNQRARINSQISQISNNNNNIQGSQEEAELLNRMNDAERQMRRGRGRGRRMNIVNRISEQQQRVLNTNLDPDNSFYDRESDENFEIQENEVEQESEEVVSEEEKSEDEAMQNRYNRENYHQTMQNRRTVTQGQVNRIADTLENNRAQRALRRQTRLQQENNDEDEGDEPEYQGRRTRRRVVTKSEDSSENDISEDNDYKMSGDENQPRRRLQRNNRQNNLRLSDSEESEDDDQDQTDYGIITRNARNEKKLKKQSGQNQQRQRNLRARDNRKTYRGMDSSEDNFMDIEEEKKERPHSRRISSQEERPGSQDKRNKRLIKEEDSEDDIVDQDVILPDSKQKLKGDEDFELVIQNDLVQLEEEMMQDDSKKCEFCKRNDPPIIGPFARSQMLKGKEDQQYFFHKDCIEVNNYSFFNKQKQKWMNIGKAIEQFTKKPSMCRRCTSIGATIKCSSCDKYYHGFLCSQLYMIFTGNQSYQCFECRNRENFNTFHGKGQLMEKQELKILKRNMIRDHILATKQNKITYTPQINDLVYYFFQGHEKFISYYNCYFYGGDSEDLNFDYPWNLYEELEKPILCRIKNMSYSFPSKNVLYLLKRFGKSSSIVQLPQIITHLDLQIVNAPEKTFSIDFFPNELPDFLVLKNLYENSLYFYQFLLEQGKLIGQSFKARVKNFNQVKILGIQEREKLLYDQTGWETVLYRHVDNYRLRERGRRGLRLEGEDQNPPEIMNFWELILDQQIEMNDENIGITSAFDDNEIQRVIGIIQDYCERKKEQTVPFMERVSDKIAPDYRQHVPAEMYIALVLERLINKFYRTQEQLFSDLDLISYNAKIYNGDDNPIYKNAKKMVEGFRCEIKKNLNYSDDYKKQKFEETKYSMANQKPIGKLTAPIYRNNMNYSSMDQFKQTINIPKESLEEVKISQVNNQRTNRRQREIEQMNYPQQAQDIKLELDGSSDFKTTPNNKISANGNQMIQDSNQNVRRQTRNNNLIQIKNDNFYDASAGQYSTGEKSVNKESLIKNEQDEEQEVQLGKRTRSGRQTRQMRQTLNDNDSDNEFEKLINGNDGKINGSTSNKRIRQH